MNTRKNERKVLFFWKKATKCAHKWKCLTRKCEKLLAIIQCQSFWLHFCCCCCNTFFFSDSSFVCWEFVCVIDKTTIPVNLRTFAILITFFSFCSFSLWIQNVCEPFFRCVWICWLMCMTVLIHQIMNKIYIGSFRFNSMVCSLYCTIYS